MAAIGRHGNTVKTYIAVSTTAMRASQAHASAACAVLGEDWVIAIRAKVRRKETIKSTTMNQIQCSDCLGG